MKNVKIFLDDFRQPGDCLGYMHSRVGELNSLYNEEWIVVKNYEEFADKINHHIMLKDTITHVSFDHDLSEEHYIGIMMSDDVQYNTLYNTFKEKTGLECAKFFIELYKQLNLKLPVIMVHSMNPAGTQNIINLFKGHETQ